MKHCIACAEEIKEAALLCRWCRTKQNDPAFKNIDNSEGMELQTSSTLKIAPWALERSYKMRTPESQSEPTVVADGSDPVMSPVEVAYRELRKNSSKLTEEVGPSDEHHAPRNILLTKSVWGVLVFATFIVGSLAYIYNPNLQASVDGWLTNLFSETGSHFTQGYEDAKKNGAEKNDSIAYANAYCSIVTGAQNLPSHLAQQEYFKGCVAYITAP